MMKPNPLPTQPTPPEAELLLCCARTRMDAENALFIQALLQEGVDWSHLLMMARVHGIMSLLYWHLRAHGRGLVPKNVSKQLQDFYEANSRRSLFLTGELTRVLHLLEENGIIGIPFKGPALAASAYGDLSLREFTDLDILIQREDVPRARALMGTLGYRPVPSIFDSHMEAYLRSRYELPFVSRDGRYFIEIGWEIVPKYFGFPLAPLELWESLNAPDNQCGFRTLRPEETLLLLCVHGAKHLWQRLRWICDVAGLISVNEDLQWTLVMKRAEKLGSLRILYLGLALVKDVLGVSVPWEVLREVEADRVVRRLVKKVRMRIIQGSQRAPGPLRSSVFHIRARERAANRLKYCVQLGLTTTPEDRAALPLPVPFLPVYHLIRPVRLVAKHMLATFMRVPLVSQK